MVLSKDDMIEHVGTLSELTGIGFETLLDYTGQYVLCRLYNGMIVSESPLVINEGETL